MESVDHILSNWENENHFIREASVLEKLVHNLHKYETFSVSGKIYRKLKRRGQTYKQKIKNLCKCMKEEDAKVLEELEEYANKYRHEDEEASGHSRHSLPDISLNSSTAWEFWKTQLTVPDEVQTQWNHELAHYIY